MLHRIPVIALMLGLLAFLMLAPALQAAIDAAPARISDWGPEPLKRDIATWLGRNYFADIKPAR